MRTAAIITSALLLAGFIGYKLLLGGIAYNIGEADTLAKITSKESTAEAKTVAAAVPVFGADKPGRSALKPSTPPDASAILAAATPFHKEKAIAPATIAEPQPGPAPVERNDNANRKVGPVPKLPAAQPKAPETRKQAERVVTPPLPSTTTSTANSSKEVVKPLAVAKSQPQGESPKPATPASTLGMPTPAANEKPSTGATPTAADQRTKESALKNSFHARTAPESGLRGVPTSAVRSVCGPFGCSCAALHRRKKSPHKKATPLLAIMNRPGN